MQQLRRAAPALAPSRSPCPAARFLALPRPRAAAPRRAAARTAEDYAAALRETGDDWTRTLELVTEVNILRVTVAPDALECAVVSFARGGQWQRAEALYRGLRAQGHAPGAATTTALVAGLAGSQQGGRAAELLGELAAAQGGPAGLGPAYNVVVRALARQGELDVSFGMLTRMMRDGALVEGGTFTYVATCCMEAQRTELAEEVLEMRDYL